MAQAARVNGDATSWSDISFPILGVIIDDISEINYGFTQEKPKQHGRGTKPIKRGMGKEDFTGSITIGIEVYDALVKTLPPGRGINNIKSFQIPVVYSQDGILKTVHRLKDVQFLGAGVEVKSGDGSINMKLELSIMDIIWN